MGVIELELSSYCNAKCPLCIRTMHPDKFELKHITLDDIIKILPLDKIKEQKFKFSGVLGDPLMNPEVLEIAQYLLANGSHCINFSTNAGIRTEELWYELGKLSNASNDLFVHFCVDGFKETNHIYRVGTDFDIIERNMLAYKHGGGHGAWIYIVFDHNEHEIELARERAKELNLEFITRTGMRNSLHNFTSMGHTKFEEFKELRNTVTTNKVSKELIDSVVCKYVHDDEIFITYDLKLFPCCFLWDSYFRNYDSIQEKLTFDDPSWNDLNVKTIDEVIQHEYYQTVLEESWKPTHGRHLKRCLLTCANNKMYQNEFQRMG